VDAGAAQAWARNVAAVAALVVHRVAVAEELHAGVAVVVAQGVVVVLLAVAHPLAARLVVAAYRLSEVLQLRVVVVAALLRLVVLLLPPQTLMTCRNLLGTTRQRRVLPLKGI